MLEIQVRFSRLSLNHYTEVVQRLPNLQVKINVNFQKLYLEKINSVFRELVHGSTKKHSQLCPRKGALIRFIKITE